MPKYRLGRSLVEEVAACLLGGHGLPAIVGLAAFKALREAGLLRRATNEEALYLALSKPFDVEGRSVRYRFARQKARYLAAALALLHGAEAPTSTGRDLRDWLLQIPGIGPKTASWIARNWLDADDVAILDIHILRAGVLGGFLDARLTVDRHYLALEEQFLRFSKALDIRPSELDAVIWLEMMSSAKGRRKPSSRARAPVPYEPTKAAPTPANPS